MDSWTVPQLWPGETVAILGGGPSLTPEQVERVSGHAPILAINNSWRLAPHAVMAYGADALWWQFFNGVPDFHGLKVSCEENAAVSFSDVHWIRHQRLPGLSFDPACLRTGSQNSGFQAMNLAVLAGARRILLLGFDMRFGPQGQSHWHGDHPRGLNNPSEHLFKRWRAAFGLALPDLEKAGVEVLNCTPGSALECFPFADLRTLF